MKKNKIRYGFILYLFISNFIAMSSLAQSSKKIIVALDGSGNYAKIQDAIDAVLPNQEQRTIIYIKNGLYDTEKSWCQAIKEILLLKVKVVIKLL